MLRRGRMRGSVLQAPARDEKLTNDVEQQRREEHQLELFLRHHKDRPEQLSTKIEPLAVATESLSSIGESNDLSNADKAELVMLRKKQELLHCLLPPEIVNSIHHHWYESCDHDDIKLSSWENNSIPSSIVYNPSLDSVNNENGTRLAPLDKSKHSVMTLEETQNSATTTSSRTLYSEDAQDITLMFIDIVGFSAISSEIPSSEVMDMLQDLFQRFDLVCQKHQILKLDTIGDAYLCSVGFFDEHNNDLDSNDHARRCASRALAGAKEMIRESKKVRVPRPSSHSSANDEHVSVRIGIHVGDATYGVLGQSLPKLVCIGNAVNMAARMEQTSTANMIHATKTFHDLIGDSEDGWESSEMVEIKNMGEVEAYLLDPLKGKNESCWC